jgi:uncharacterized OsmC-like protein
VDALGADDGPSPRENLLIALSSCTAMTIRTFFENTKSVSGSSWQPSSLEHIAVNVKEVMGEHAHIPIEIIIRINLRGNLNSHQKNRLIRAAENCPIKKIISGGNVKLSVINDC